MLREKFLRSLPRDEEMVSLSFFLPFLSLFAMLLPLLLLFAMLLHDFQQGERAVGRERGEFSKTWSKRGTDCFVHVVLDARKSIVIRTKNTVKLSRL